MADVKNTQAIFSAMLESRASRKASENARKVESKRFLKEATGASMFTGCLLKESVCEAFEDDTDVVDDIVDNIVVVTDPDKSVKDLESRADDIQDAIEGNTEGEAAFSDEYVGNKVYACPICGESFFADEDYKEGDSCPICKAEPNDGFLLQGVVAALEPEEDEIEGEGEGEEVIEDEEIIDDEAPEETEETEEIAEEDEIESEEETEDEEAGKEESYKRQTESVEETEVEIVEESSLAGGPNPREVKDAILALLNKRSPDLKNDNDKLVKGLNTSDMNKAAENGFDFDNIKTAYTKYNKGETNAVEISDGKNKAVINSSFKGIITECDEPTVEIEIEVNCPEEKPECDVLPDVEFDETSFDNCLNQFADENYGDCIDSMNVEEVTYVPAEDVLRVECKAVTKEGKEVPVTFNMKEEECDNGVAKLVATESTNVFKIESKKPAFEFKVVRKGKALKCEAMKYNYITTHSKVGKVKVEGLCRNRRARASR